MADTEVLAHNDAAAKNWTAFSRAWHNGHKQYVLDAERYNDYYLGEQWDAKEKADLEGEGRPALTLNEILQVVNAVIGHYTQTQADINFKARRGAASRGTAEVLTKLTNQILEQNNYAKDVEPNVFQDGVIEDRGYFDVRMDFTDNVLGDARVRALDPRQVVPDPDANSYDPADWKEVTINSWMSLDDVEAYYGKAKRRKVESLATTPGNTYGDLSVKYQGFGDSESNPTGDAHSDVKSVRVIDRQHRRMARALEFVDLQTGETRTVPANWERAQAEVVAEEYGLFLRHRIKSRIRWTVSVDHVTLHDDWSPYNELTVVPFFPMFRRGRPSGLVRHLIDPQEQLNKIESQILHTINTTANSGWLAESGSLVNMTEDELERRGAETGLVLVYGRNRQPPQKIQPNQVPAGLENYAHKAGEYIRNIPGASALLGQAPSTNVSGVALDTAQGKALVGLQVFFQNLELSRKLVAKRVLDCVQAFYTEHRVFSITNWEDPEQPDETIEINAEQGEPPAQEAPVAEGEERPANPMANASNVAHNVTVGTYDIIVSSSPARDTWEETQFARLLELRKAGVLIPDHHVILHSQISGKKAIAAEVKQLQGLGEVSEEDQRLAQLEMAKAEAEVAKAQAEVADLEAKAQHTAAQAQTEVASEKREREDMLAKYRMELARLKADLMKKRQDVESKRELAEIHTGAKEALTRYQSTRQGHENRRERENRLEQEQLRQGGAVESAREGNDAKVAVEGMRDRTELMREQMRERQQQGQRDLAAAAGSGQ